MKDTKRIKVTLSSSLDSNIIYRWKELAKNRKINHSNVFDFLLEHYIKTNTVFPIATIYKNCSRDAGSPDYIYVNFKNSVVVDWLNEQQSSGANLSNLLKTILFSSINLCDNQEEESILSPIEISSALIRKVSLQGDMTFTNAVTLNSGLNSSLSSNTVSSESNDNYVTSVDLKKQESSFSQGHRDKQEWQQESSSSHSSHNDTNEKHNLGISKDVLSNHLFARMGALGEDDI